MPEQADLALRILIAALLGGFIGLEREMTGQNAGLRTHITISLGAALFAIISAYGFDEFNQARADTNLQVDVTRIASNVVTGVGFLGGGAIIKHGGSVTGLTTAASMWVTAAVGLGTGLGSFFPAAATTAVLLFVLTALRKPRRWISQRAAAREMLLIELHRDADPGLVVDALLDIHGIEVNSVSVRNAGDGRRSITADVKGTELPTRLAELAERDDVDDLDIGA